MRKGMNLFWIGLVLLCGIAVLLSQQQCVKFTPTKVVGLPFETNPLPEPSYRGCSNLVWKSSLICIIAMWFRNGVVNVAGCLVATFQAVAACYLPQMYDLFDEMWKGYGPGTVLGEYTMTPRGYVLCVLCIVIVAYAVWLSLMNKAAGREACTASEA